MGHCIQKFQIDTNDTVHVLYGRRFYKYNAYSYDWRLCLEVRYYIWKTIIYEIFQYNWIVNESRISFRTTEKELTFTVPLTAVNMDFRSIVDAW